MFATDSTVAISLSSVYVYQIKWFNSKSASYVAVSSNINPVGRWLTACRAVRQLRAARLSQDDWWWRTAVSPATLDSQGSTPVHYTYEVYAELYRKPKCLNNETQLCPNNRTNGPIKYLTLFKQNCTQECKLKPFKGTYRDRTFYNKHHVISTKELPKIF